MKTKMQQAPIRNANTIGAFVYSHSGEFAPVCPDLHLTGRGLDFKFIRAYRSSLVGLVGDLGRGWSASIAKKIELEDDDLIYHDGAGEAYKFTLEQNGNYTPPTGFYGILLQEGKQVLFHQRYGLKYRFEIPEQGGRIVSIEDRNQNTIQFSYSADGVVIIDTLKRNIAILVNQGLVQELKDHAGRTWKYTYDEDDRLIEVTQPATADFPQGTSVKYAYDTNHRLISVTDAKGQKYLVNHYDKSGKVIAQEHGSGIFKMEYDAIGEGENGFSIYSTTCIRKNGSKLVLEHNAVGNVLSRTLYVRQESFAPHDSTGLSGNDVALITNSTYNKNSELTSRLFPSGNQTEWVYSEDEKHPLNQGNLLQITELPQAGVESDQARIVTQYEYEPEFQLTTTLIDPRGSTTAYRYDEKGNLIVTTYPSVTIQPVNSGTPRPTPLNRIQQDEYQYNSMGQLLRRKQIDDSITEYHYYPIDDPTGTGGPNSATNDPDKICGYLARVVRDANGTKIKNEYAYDNFGNATTLEDGKSNPARLRYNAMGKVESVTSREPFKYRIDYRYDANYNEIESTQSFERLEYDETNQTTRVTSSTLRELTEYNALDNVILRKIVGDDKIITEYFIRDADDNIIRQIQPLGNATEYVYDERYLLIEKKFGVGTREAFSYRFTYTLNGAVRTYTDGNGKKTTHHYDGFHRYKGFTNPVGTKKTQWFDEADNVVRVEIDGDNGDRGPLIEATYHFDQWNRAYRVDRAWHNHSDGQQLGESQWNGEKGIVSTVLEYAENGLPGKVWTETDNVVGVEYDGVGRVVKVKDLTGEEFSFEYDENNNPTLLKHLGPEVQGRRFERVLRRRYDEMDRLIWQQENDEAPERFAYNALGNVINYVGKSGIEIHHTDDTLGRRVGHAFSITDALDSTTVQQIVRRFEYDDNYRLSAYTDATGQRTLYRYDTLDRHTGVVFPDGTAANVEYDANGNIVRVVDQNNNEINNRYDDSNRLLERRSLIMNTGSETVEQYEYDGLGRLVAAITPDAAIRRTYDSLSRLLTEEQGDRVLQCVHNSAGNLTSLVYPGGDEVHNTYDIRNRVTSVKDKAGETIASFIYRANDQLARMLLGSVIETDYSYNKQERLESIEYRRTDNQELVDGFQYQYDDTGKITHEIQLSEGSTYGDRYYYDDANRAIKAQYGVEDVFDPNSSFEQETSYEHFPEGSWKRRIDFDGQGQMMDDQIGTVNHLNNYEHFGNYDFAYDANGNCIYKGKSNPGYCDLAYDHNNRVIKAECYDAQGDKTQTIEYFYDALGRQVRKVVTDQSGNVTEYTYVWAGTILLEEYENGVLVRTYFYGNSSLPVQLSEDKGGRSNYYYTHNGRELISRLVYQLDPNTVANWYRYEVPAFLGMHMPPALRDVTTESVANSLVAPGYLWDFENYSFSFLGIQFKPEIATVMSGGNGFKGYTGGATGAFFKQLRGFLNGIGLGSDTKGPPGAPKTGGLPPGVQLGFRGPNMSLYGNASDGGTPSGSAGFGDSRVRWIENAGKSLSEGLNGTYTIGPSGGLENSNGAWLGGLIGGALAGFGNPAKDDKLVQGAPTQNRKLGEAQAQKGNKADQAKEQEKAVRKANDALEEGKDTEWQQAKKEKKEREKEDKKKEAGDFPIPDDSGGTTALVNPDADTTVYLLSPQQIEAKLMQNKKPMNPNGGYGSPGIEPPSSKGPGKMDLIAYYTDDGQSGFGGDGQIDILFVTGGGFTDFVRGGTLEMKIGVGGTTGQPLP